MTKPKSWWSPEMTGNELANVAGVIERNYINEGPETKKLEQLIQQDLNVAHAIMVPNGTSAIYLALKAVGIGKGDEVIVPDITFIATANAVEATGAKAVLAKINLPNVSLNLEDVREKITAKCRAIIPVHVSGRNSLSNGLKELAHEHDLHLIEDAAEALGSKTENGYLGTIGDFGCFSLSPNKLITTGQGGILVTNDDDLARKARIHKNQGREEAGNGFRETHNFLGLNLRFTDLQAAVGLAQWDELQNRIQKQKKLADIYNSYFLENQKIATAGFDTAAGEIPLWYDLFVKSPSKLQEHLSKYNFELRPFWHPLSQQKPYQSQPTSAETQFISDHGVWLPSSFNLTEQELHQIAEIVLRYANDDPIGQEFLNA